MRPPNLLLFPEAIQTPPPSPHATNGPPAEFTIPPPPSTGRSLTFITRINFMREKRPDRYV